MPYTFPYNKLVVLLCCIPLFVGVYAQPNNQVVKPANAKDSLPLCQGKPTPTTQNPNKPDILTSGFIDIVNNGQVNASARFIRLLIGEPGKFTLPLSIYSGVSANSFGQAAQPGLKSNDQLINQLINPLSGLINLSADGLVYFKKNNAITKIGLLYHGGGRVLTGFTMGAITNPQTGKPVNFINSFGSVGLYFQTGAWERSNASNQGIFWLTYRYIATYTNPKQLKSFLPAINTNGLYYGYCIGGGIEINNLINIKLLYYKYQKQPEIEYALPIYQFTFNYALKN